MRFANIEEYYEHYREHGEATPEVGDPATLNIGTDHYPYRIVRVANSRLWAVGLDFKMAEGGNWYRVQDWDVDGTVRAHVPEEMFTFRKPKHTFEDLARSTRPERGKWRPKGSDYGSLTIGIWNVRLDPGF